MRCIWKQHTKVDASGHGSTDRPAAYLSNGSTYSVDFHASQGRVALALIAPGYAGSCKLASENTSKVKFRERIFPDAR